MTPARLPARLPAGLLAAVLALGALSGCGLRDRGAAAQDVATPVVQGEPASQRQPAPDEQQLAEVERQVAEVERFLDSADAELARG